MCDSCSMAGSENDQKKKEWSDSSLYNMGNCYYRTVAYKKCNHFRLFVIPLSTDLFNVDWKMPASVLTYDSRESMVWGRRVFEVEQYGKPIWEWFPKWFMETSPFIVTLGIIGTIGCVISMFIKVKNRKGDIKRDILGIYGVVAIIAWLFSAPLIRYGMVYVLIPVCICIADLMERDGNKKFVIALNILLMLVLIPTGAGYMA